MTSPMDSLKLNSDRLKRKISKNSSKFDPDCKRKRISGDSDDRASKNTNLMAAIDNFDIKSAHELVLQRGIEGMCPIYLSRLLKRAMEADNAQLVKDLLAKDPKFKTESGKSALWEAVLTGATNVATMLVRNGANLTERHNFSSFLHVLVSSEDRSKHELAVLMLDHGANPRSTDALGNSVLHCALRSKSQWLIGQLLERGADVGKCNKYEESVLIQAACRPEARQWIDFLLRHGTTNERQRNLWIKDAILTCAKRDDVNLSAAMALCASDGFTIDQGNDMYSLVTQAIFDGAKKETIELLIKLGSDLTDCNDEVLVFFDDNKLKKIKCFIKRSVLDDYKSKISHDSEEKKGDGKLKEYYEQCLSEIQYMKDFMVNEHLPMIEILTIRTKLLSWIMRNTNLVEIYEKNRDQTKKSCPIYFEDLEAAFTKAMNRYSILVLKEEAFTKKLKNFLPSLVLDKIFLYVYMNFNTNTTPAKSAYDWDSITHHYLNIRAR